MFAKISVAQSEDSIKATLSKLNKQFIQNFLREDTVAHAKLVHPDFVCIESDGRIVDRNTYLTNWATDFRNSGYRTFSYKNEFIRVFGNVALVRAMTVYTTATSSNPKKGYTIYTDTYLNEGGEWRCVQVQITPVKEKSKKKKAKLDQSVRGLSSD